MDKVVNLFLFDMSSKISITGVNRYLEVLVNGLKNQPDINVHWINLDLNNKLLFHKEERFNNYLKITIPLPQQFDEILAEMFWLKKYNAVVFEILKPIFHDKNNIVLHIHTLNLIELALLIKDSFKCQIITHLHCIPWKNLYNTDEEKFNYLYQLNHIDKVDFNEFMTNSCEFSSYHKADHVICVTKNAKDFLKKVVQKKEGSVTVIQNGMQDYYKPKFKTLKNNNDPIKLIYVGVLSKSKGIYFLLEALSELKKKGYHVSLTIVGKYDAKTHNNIKSKYNNLNLNILGLIPFDCLKKHYQESDIGVITSLQEQASYVAIEMAMFGLPIVTTNVDGLDETFTNENTALKVNTKFSKVKGLTVDVAMLADKIIDLIENKEKRIRIGKNARKLYKKKLSLNEMLDKTVEVYKKSICYG